MSTRIFNGGTTPLVPAGQWGQGVVMPGEFIDVDDPEGYAVNRPNSPWVTDPEAVSALQSLAEAQAGDSSDSAPDGHSESQVTPQGPLPDPTPGVPAESGGQSEPFPQEPPAGAGPELHTLPNGDVVNQSGEVVGHIEPSTAANSTQEA